MVGYAKDNDSRNQNTQKYNCNKLLEYNVGVPLETDKDKDAKFDIASTLRAIKFLLEEDREQVTFIRQHVTAFGGVLDT